MPDVRRRGTRNFLGVQAMVKGALDHLHDVFCVTAHCMLDMQIKMSSAINANTKESTGTYPSLHLTRTNTYPFLHSTLTIALLSKSKTVLV